MNNMKKIIFTLLLSCNAFNISPVYAAEVCSDGLDCPASINTNTFDTTTSNASILTELQDNFAYGSGSFSDTSSGSSINSVLYASSYLATRFFILDLALPVFSIASNINANFNVAIEDASTFSTNLNDIHDINATLLQDNYFIPAANNGYNPITDLDISPYVYPRTSQVIKNSLTSVTPINFLNKVISNNYTIPLIRYCAARSALNPVVTDSYNCVQPIEQLNTIGGSRFNSEPYPDQSEGHINVTAPLFWDFSDQNFSPLVLPSLTADTLMNSLTYEDGGDFKNKIFVLL
jgi:hypothetical protein